jgi:hypothetical protein
MKYCISRMMIQIDYVVMVCVAFYSTIHHSYTVNL